MLPSSFDPEGVSLAEGVMRHALAGARWDHLPASERAEIVARGVGKIMAAGAFVRDGKLMFPTPQRSVSHGHR